MDVLPLKFKLYLKGKHVGFEVHRLVSGFIHIQHKGIGEDKPFLSITIHDGDYEILHDEARQFTGFLDRNGREIYLGDRVFDEVIGKNGKIGYSDSIYGICMIVFHDDKTQGQMRAKNLEVIDD